MAVARLGQWINDHYEAYEWRHASAVLRTDFPSEWADLVYVLENYRLHQRYVTTRGGGKSLTSQRIDGLFQERGWKKHRFDVNIYVDGKRHPSPTHEVDNFKNRIAQETEWNNKQEFFDRDLNNFRLLHELDVASVGIIITRADNTREIWEHFGKPYTGTSTHMEKLLPKIEGGGAGGCPILALGITTNLFLPEEP